MHTAAFVHCANALECRCSSCLKMHLTLSSHIRSSNYSLNRWLGFCIAKESVKKSVQSGLLKDKERLLGNLQLQTKWNTVGASEQAQPEKCSTQSDDKTMRTILGTKKYTIRLGMLRLGNKSSKLACICNRRKDCQMWLNQDQKRLVGNPANHNKAAKMIHGWQASKQCVLQTFPVGTIK